MNKDYLGTTAFRTSKSITGAVYSQYKRNNRGTKEIYFGSPHFEMCKVFFSIITPTYVFISTLMNQLTTFPLFF